MTVSRIISTASVLPHIMIVIAGWCHFVWAAEDRQPFTVKDLIEISYIINPEASTTIDLPEVPPVGVPIVSPNRKYFLLITDRGVLPTNCLEATIWMFDRQAVADYSSGQSRVNPPPTPIATLHASSNTPVISDVRWLDDSANVAFLGKRDSPYQQLFIADVRTGSLKAVTGSTVYVSAYDIAGDTIAYSSLITDDHDRNVGNEIEDVTGQGIYSLLYPHRKAIEDLDQWDLITYPSELHIKRHGQELAAPFIFAGQPLRLFIPSLSLSPDGKYLITVAPVKALPAAWARYEPAVHDDLTRRLDPSNKYALDETNPWKASQYVLIDINNGSVSPLVDAPAGRGLVYVAPTKALWFSDSSRAVLSNTYLPLSNTTNDEDRRHRLQGPFIAVVNVLTRELEPVTPIKQSPFGTTVWYHLADVSWNEEREELDLVYGGTADAHGVPPPERYQLRAEGWKKQSSSPASTPVRTSEAAIGLAVHQDLNHSPVLSRHIGEGTPDVIVWDPNPQLAELNRGTVSIYRWRARNGYWWSGLLALPPDYDSTRRYPLVIQTHGYEAGRFFADGKYTTSSGGLALVAKGIIVLQMDLPMLYLETPNDGPFALDGFESAIRYLSADGFIDPAQVGIIGFSYTCSHVLYAMTKRPDLFAAASITDGNNMSYVQYILSTDTGNGLQEISEKANRGKPFGKGLIGWATNAPNFNLDKATTPLLISSFEPGELLAQWETYSALRILRRPVDMLWLRKENAPHILVKPRQRYLSQQMAVEWFSFWLKGEEDHDPAKNEQYARWHELRLQSEHLRVARHPSP
jgi:dipeptidyl aminopeptidase/acylaminoacyl peptidase